ncbi:MAG: response regulator [Deltaproteobacteria bacterium]|nr:response regulator [Deltaproteobacteria bacterium]
MDEKNRPLILVIEDNDDNRRLVIKVLGSRDYEVVGVTDGRQALARLDSIRPDLILMDINLPDMDGYEVTRQIRRQKDFAQLPIVALTAHAMVGDEEKSLAAGCNAYITKPINVRTFPQTIAAILKEHRS